MEKNLKGDSRGGSGAVINRQVKEVNLTGGVQDGGGDVTNRQIGALYLISW